MGGTLTSGPGATLVLAGDVTNDGAITADGADVNITGTAFTNSATASLDGSGGTIVRSGNASISGSTVTAPLTVTGTTTLNGITSIDGPLASAALVVASDAIATLTGGGSVDSTIDVASGASLTFATNAYSLNDGTTLQGGGTFNLGSAVIAGATTGVTVAADTSASLAGALAGSGRLNVNGTLSSTGTSSFAGPLVIASTGSLLMPGGGSLSLGAVTNNGTLQVGNDGSTAMNASLSYTSLANAGELRITRGLGGTRTLTGTLNNSGTVRVVDTRADFDVGGAASSTGTIAVEGSNGFADIDNATTFTGAGNVALQPGARLRLARGEYLWTGGNISGAADSQFTVAETLRASGGGTRTLTAPLVSDAVIVDSA